MKKKIKYRVEDTKPIYISNNGEWIDGEDKEKMKEYESKWAKPVCLPTKELPERLDGEDFYALYQLRDKINEIIDYLSNSKELCSCSPCQCSKDCKHCYAISSPQPLDKCRFNCINCNSCPDMKCYECQACEPEEKEDI